MDFSRYWLVRAISSGTGHDSDGFIADERAMGVYHFCLDRRLTDPPDSEKTCISCIETTSGSSKPRKTMCIFCLDRRLGLGGLEAWKLGGLEGWVKSRTVGVYFHAI